MNVELKSAFLSGNIKAIPSKSYAHRIAICNFLAGKNPVSNCGEFRSNDIVVTEKCLSDLRAGQTVLDCGESGSTLRFLIPLCATIGGEFEFICHGKLIERPNVELFSAIEKNGVTAIQTDKIYLKGKLEAGKFFVKGNVSSQYVSGLLMALPFLKEDSEIVLTTPLSSAPYVDITIQVLNAFGVDVQKTANGFFVKGGQRYCGNIKPEGDWSNSAFFLCAGAINGDVAVSGLNLDSVQGDKQILQVLESAGATVIKNQVGV